MDRGSHGRKPVTMKDIAERVGVSINTVCHALRDENDISEETKQIIRRTADEMGYIRNASASSLRSGVTKTVALILGSISNPYFSIMAQDAENFWFEKGYTMMIFNTNEDPALERKAIETAVGKNADGILISPAPGGEDNIRFLKRLHKPFVLVGRHFPEKGIAACSVRRDDAQGGYLLAQHLLSLGHRKIAFLHGPLSISSSTERLSGYLRALREADMPIRPELIYEVPVTMEKNQGVLRSIFSNRPDCTAVIAFNDMIAWEIISLLNRAGLRVPDDLSIVGFDNIQAQFTFPAPLTSVSSERSLGLAAAEALLARIRRPASEPIEEILSVKLTVRESTRPL